jgi:hypothetical protein
MSTMKSVRTAGPGAIEVVEVERPVPGPPDVRGVRSVIVAGILPGRLETALDLSADDRALAALRCPAPRGFR